MAGYNWDTAYESRVFEHWEWDRPSPELVALVAAGVIRPGTRVLDLGSGGGLEAIFLAGCGCSVVGVDFSGKALEIASRRAIEARLSVKWCLASVLNLPLADASIDFACDRGLFHVLEDADRRRYAAELSRVLGSGAKILLRGASEEEAERFNPVTAAAIDQYLGPPAFSRGPVLPLPLLSIEGVLSGSIVVLTRTIGT
jgi:ubiquinone/menaquinone biosynthesis C-methylase UbiE